MNCGFVTEVKKTFQNMRCLKISKLCQFTRRGLVFGEIISVVLWNHSLTALITSASELNRHPYSKCNFVRTVWKKQLIKIKPLERNGQPGNDRTRDFSLQTELFAS